MELNSRIKTFVQLGEVFHHLSQKNTWPGYNIGLNETEYSAWQELIKNVHIYNPWFSEDNVRMSLHGFSKWLQEDKLKTWLNQYEVQEGSADITVGIVAAGNIPMVGFHDIMSVLISGYKLKIKLSGDDIHLMEQVLATLKIIDPRWQAKIEITDKLKDFDAVIATGSNNSARYFEQYFSKYPHIIRKNRSSVAVLSGDESKEELTTLGQDIFLYFGMGCRNVSKIFIPEGYDLDHLFKAIIDYGDIINHNKYANNFDYNKAIYLMNQDQILTNGFMILKEDTAQHAPLSVVFYERYDKQKTIDQYLERNKEELQCIVSQKHTPFGQAQFPDIDDYADNIDTMKFLTGLGK